MTRFVFDLPLIVALLVIAIGAKRFTPLYRRRMVLWVSTFLMTIGSILFVIYSLAWTRSELVLFISAGLSGIGLAAIVLLWYEVYGALPLTKVMIYYCSSLLFGALIGIFINGLTLPYRMGLIVCLPVLSALSLTMSYNDIPEERRPRSFSTATSFPWKPVALLILYNLAWGVSRGFAGADHRFYTVGVVIPSSLILICAFFFPEKLTLSAIHRAVWSVMIVGLLLIPLLGDQTTTLAEICVNTSYFGLIVLTTMILSDIIFRFEISAIWIWGYTRAACLAAALFGEVFTRWLLTSIFSGTVRLATIATAIAILVILSILFLFGERELASRWGISIDASPNAGEAYPGRPRVLLRCAEIAREHNLSPREEEVLLLLAQGDRTRDIERQLFIAHGTAKAHIGRIYAKIGIHSRQELQDVLNRGFSGGANVNRGT